MDGMDGMDELEGLEGLDGLEELDELDELDGMVGMERLDDKREGLLWLLPLVGCHGLATVSCGKRGCRCCSWIARDA